MSNFWGAVHDDLLLFTDRISAALSYNAVPAVYKAMTADKESDLLVKTGAETPQKQENATL